MKKLLVLSAILSIVACSMGPEIKDGMSFGTTGNGTGQKLALHFKRGPHFAHTKKFGFGTFTITPQISVWLEDSVGNYIGTVYVTKRFGKQEWYGIKSHPDSCYRTSCMPYWFNRYKKAGNDAPTKGKPLTDAVCGATPTGSFTINLQLPDSVKACKLYAEWNSSFDNNETFTKENASFNGQPSVVTCAYINLADTTRTIDTLKVAGYGGSNGDDATLYKDVEKLSTALSIFGTITAERVK